MTVLLDLILTFQSSFLTHQQHWAQLIIPSSLVPFLCLDSRLPHSSGLLCISLFASFHAPLPALSLLSDVLTSTRVLRDPSLIFPRSTFTLLMTSSSLMALNTTSMPVTHKSIYPDQTSLLNSRDLHTNAFSTSTLGCLIDILDLTCMKLTV